MPTKTARAPPGPSSTEERMAMIFRLKIINICIRVHYGKTTNERAKQNVKLQTKKKKTVPKQHSGSDASVCGNRWFWGRKHVKRSLAILCFIHLEGFPCATHIGTVNGRWQKSKLRFIKLIGFIFGYGSNRLARKKTPCPEHNGASHHSMVELGKHTNEQMPHRL